MQFSWVLADTLMLGPEVNVDELKKVGAFWGGWRTWRAYGTDNVVCNDLTRASELVKRNFQTECNFYIPNNNYQTLGRPEGVRLYEGEFVHDVDRRDEIVAMHLAASTSDIVLLLGFDLSEPVVNPDKILEIQARNYRGLVRQVIASNKKIQWVLIDHPKTIMKSMWDLENLTIDELKTVVPTSN
jgi:hypothetical protein